MNPIRRRLLLTAAGAPLAGALARASAQDFPSKPITIVVPYPAGGIVDVVNRQIADAAGRLTGHRFVIDNRPGGIGLIGADYVARARPDGYTILSGSSSELIVVPAFGVKPPFDPETDLLPITQWVRGNMILVVPSTLGVSTLAQLVDLAKQRKEPLIFGSAGPGAITYFATRLLEKSAGIELQEANYKSASQALMDLLPGRIHLQFDFVATSIAHIRAGQLKALMTTHPRRIPVLPEVPAARELGYPELEIATMSGYLAPKGTPREIVNALNRILVAAIKSPEIERTFRERGAEAIGNSPEEFSAALTADRARWAEIVRQTGIRAQQ